MGTIERSDGGVRSVGRRPAHYDANAAAFAGFFAGFIAGAVLGAILMLKDLAVGHPAWGGLRGVGAIFLGRSAAGDRFETVSMALGLAAHFGLSLAFGLAFGLVAFCWQRATVVWASAVWGLLVYSFMAFVALPQVSPAMALGELSFLSVTLHLAFGVVLGASYEALRFRSSVTHEAPHRGTTITFPPSPAPR